MAGSVRPKDISAIEYLIRKTNKMIEGWQDEKVRDCRVSLELISKGDGRRSSDPRYVRYHPS